MAKITADPRGTKDSIDAVATTTKADLDTIVPPDALIQETVLSSASRQAVIIIDAGGSAARASTIIAQITDNLRTQARVFTTNPLRRASDGQLLNPVYIVSTPTVTYRIVNF